MDITKESIKTAISLAVIGGTMKFLKKLAAKVVLRIITKQKEKIISLLNAKIDLPKLDEAQEKKILESVYNAMIETIEIVLGIKKK